MAGLFVCWFQVSQSTIFLVDANTVRYNNIVVKGER